MLYLQLFRANRRKKQQKNNNNKEECREEMLKEGKKDTNNSMKPIKLLNPVFISVSFILFWLPLAVVEILKTTGTFAKSVSVNKVAKIKWTD